MIKTIYWAYMTQFRYNKELSVWFRFRHAYKMAKIMYSRPKTARNKSIDAHLKTFPKPTQQGTSPSGGDK